MTLAEAREVFPNAVRVERCKHNGKPTIKIITTENGHETWHYIRQEKSK